MGANNVTGDTFSHTSNTQRENANTIFTSKKLDQLDELADAVKGLQSTTPNIMNQTQKP